MKRFLLLAAAALTLGGCSLETTAPPGSADPSDRATETFSPSLNIVISQMTKTEAGCYYKDLSVGTGETLTGNAIVTESYLGLLKDGSVFTQTLSTTVALGTLVGGLQDAMRGMKAGGDVGGTDEPHQDIVRRVAKLPGPVALAHIAIDVDRRQRHSGSPVLPRARSGSGGCSTTKRYRLI